MTTTKGRAAMWANSKTFSAMAVAFALLGGCGKTNTTESGETHFVMCDTDVDCEGVSGAHTCEGGLCRGPSNVNGSSGSSNGASGSTSSSGPPACESACGSSECATPGSCTLEAACKVVNCGSVQVDENACLRPICQSDDDCSDDERCTSIYWSRQYQCEQVGSTCKCNAGLGLFPMHLCSPVGIAGTRGTWDKLVVKDTVIGMLTQHELSPDGAVSASYDPPEEAPASKPPPQLSPEDLDALERLVNGPLLRLALADPTDCPLTKSRDVIVQLYLQGSTTPLEKNVAGCLGGADEVPAFTQLMELTNRY